MGLRINTNIAAQYAVYNLEQTNNKLSLSLNRLSTGLRITKAADDAAGMTIADGLKFQSMNLGQAIANGNNAIKLIQIADMALQKSIDIVQTIAQKATQAANATEDKSSREAIQAEINKLIQEVNNIAETTSYKDTKLLDGTFLGKVVHIGAYMDQTISIGALSTKANAIGRVADHELNNVSAAATNKLWGSMVTLNNNINRVVYQNDVLKINDTYVGNKITGINEDRQISAKTIAAAINSVSDQTGVEAKAETVVTGGHAIQAGSIADGGLIINGVNIGAVTVGAGDATGALVNAINEYTDQTGVIASVNNNGQLVLTATDGRNISVKVSQNAADITGLTNKYSYLNADDNGKGTLGSAVTLYVDGVEVALAKGTTAQSAANLINTALQNAGINTDTQLKASYNAYGVTLSALDGRDLNVVLKDAPGKTLANSTLGFFGLDANGAQNATSQAYLLENNSNHGRVELISDKDIYVTTKNDSDIALGFKSTKLGLNNTLQDVNVTTVHGAELAIKIAQTALSNLDAVRASLGAIQNQIQATVQNISVTQININGAESTIRDVNFAKESSTFSKLQILAQSGTYALAQANAVQQNVLRLLQ